MIRTRYLILFMVFFALLLAPIVRAENINDLAYENRIILKAGTILNNEQNGEWKGIGDCLIFPYYDARQVDGMTQTTVIKIKNISEYGIVARLRFREWSRGSEVFSKDIWIPSSSLSDDVAWQGTIESNADGTNVVITSFDNVIWRNDTNSFYLSDSLSSGSPFSTRKIRRSNGESTLYGSIEVIGEEKTSPDNINGSVARLAKIERDCPNTLMGKVFVDRLDEGVSMRYDAVAIGNFSRGQGSLFKSVTSPYPRLDTCEDTLDQLEFQLSKSEVYAPLVLSPSNQGKTSLIITYPTKSFHYQNGSRINQVNNPFEASTQTMGERLQTALSEQGQKFVDSFITLPYSVNVIGLYKDYTGKPFGIDNVVMPTFSSELGEATLTSDNLSQRILVADYEYYSEGRFTMYKGLPAVGLVLQESRDSDPILTPVEYSSNWIASNAEVISTPATPDGPTSGMVGMSYTFTAGGSSSNLGHPIQYFFDWGDGTNSDWLAVGTTSAPHTWTTGGAFAVSVRARCATHTNVISRWSSMAVVIGIETVSAPTKPIGPSFGVVNNYSQTEYPFDKSYSYTTGGSTSSLGHPVQYFIDWGDGTNSGWLPVTPDMTISASQTWTKGGVFTIKATARCATDTSFVSNPSDGLVVTVESVSPPNMLIGEVNVLPNIQYTYSTGGAFSNLSGHQVQYFFDWGDNTNSGWLPVGTTTAPKIWPPGNATNKGVYYVKARAKCVTDVLAVSVWTSQLKVVTEWVSSPTTPAVVGASDPNAGQPGQTFTFSTGNAFSSVGHSVEYQFDWKGDGFTDLSPWGAALRPKTFIAGGTYSVRARARCATDTSIVSSWSSGLAVKIEQITVTTPTGPTTVSLSTPYTYTASGSSNIGDPVEIRFVSNGGGDSDWLPAPGGTASWPKTWTSTGSFTVMAKARCKAHPSNESDLSAGLAVTVNNPAPTLTSILPTSGNRLQTLDVVFTGANFISGVSSVSFGAGITVNSTTVNSATQITANITIAGTAATGTRSVSVINAAPGGGTAIGAFTVNNPAPTLTSILPTTGARGAPLDVVFTGTNFISGVSSVSFGADITVNSTTVDSATQITANITIALAAALGARDVSVINAAPGGGTATLTGSFTVTP